MMKKFDEVYRELALKHVIALESTSATSTLIAKLANKLFKVLSALRDNNQVMLTTNMTDAEDIISKLDLLGNTATKLVTKSILTVFKGFDVKLNASASGKSSTPLDTFDLTFFVDRDHTVGLTDMDHIDVIEALRGAFSRIGLLGESADRNLKEFNLAMEKWGNIKNDVKLSLQDAKTKRLTEKMSKLVSKLTEKFDDIMEAVDTTLSGLESTEYINEQVTAQINELSVGIAEKTASILQTKTKWSDVKTQLSEINESIQQFVEFVDNLKKLK